MAAITYVDGDITVESHKGDFMVRLPSGDGESCFFVTRHAFSLMLERGRRALIADELARLPAVLPFPDKDARPTKRASKRVKG